MCSKRKGKLEFNLILSDYFYLEANTIDGFVDEENILYNLFQNDNKLQTDSENFEKLNKKILSKQWKKSQDISSFKGKEKT